MKRAGANDRIELPRRELPPLERAHHHTRVREWHEIALGEGGQVRTQFDGDQLDAHLREGDAELPRAATNLEHE